MKIYRGHGKKVDNKEKVMALTVANDIYYYQGCILANKKVYIKNGQKIRKK